MFHTMRVLSNHWRIRMIHRWCEWFNYFNQLLWACSEGYCQPHCRSHLSSLPAGVPYFASKFRLEKIILFIVMLQTEVKLLCINSCTFFFFSLYELYLSNITSFVWLLWIHQCSFTFCVVWQMRGTR